MEFQKNTDKFSFGFSSEKVAGTGLGKVCRHNVTVNGADIVKEKNSSYRGLGCISGNNSSRLLLDYKALHPEAYHELLRLLFEKDYGAGLSHFKLEFGADINSSSGTEPSTMRSVDEKPDVTRGAGFILASDALKINPELTIDLLRWGEPGWVKKAFDKSSEKGFKARYKWYSETLKEAYNKFGIKFTHISPDANETGDANADWIVYFSENLRRDKNIPYDTSAIKIVASDEVGTRTIAAKMMQNERLRNAVDVIGLHYTTYGDENTEKLFADYGKEIWYSEGIAPSNIPELAVKKDLNGLTGRNGTIDVANRIINGWHNGKMTLYEFQPAIASYYDGSCYYPKHLIKANEPWSGHYEIGSGFYAAMHFTRFIGDNWHPVSGACFGDGEENHYIKNTTHNYMTLMPEDLSEATIILTNDSTHTRHYRFNFENFSVKGRNFSFIETSGPELGRCYDSAWFRVRETVTPESDYIDIDVKPGSILTVTTLSADFVNGVSTITLEVPKAHRLTIPYKDNFSYKKMDENFLENRGGAPLYTTDQGGAFEVENINGRNWLVQKITDDIMPGNWRFRGTPSPITCLGDDSWANYSAQVKAIISSEDNSSYVGIGVRYNSAVACEVTSNCGFALKVYATGKWETLFMDAVTAKGKADLFYPGKENILMVTAAGNLYLAYLNGKLLTSYNETSAMQVSGRVSLLSSYHRNMFTDLEITALTSMNMYVSTADALHKSVKYTGDVTLESCNSYKFSNRTSALMKKDSSFELSYKGFGFALCGSCESATVRIELDGMLLADSIIIGGTLYRQAFYRHDSCGFGWHYLKVTVLEGEITLDCIKTYSNTHTEEEFGSPIKISEKHRKTTNTLAKAAAVAAAGAVTALMIKKAFKRKK